MNDINNEGQNKIHDFHVYKHFDKIYKTLKNFTLSMK